MKKAFEEILSELIGHFVDVDFTSGFEKSGIENDLIVKLMVVKQLTRIADSLESISQIDSIDTDN